MFARTFVFSVIVVAGCVTATSPESTKPSWDRATLQAVKLGGAEYCNYIMIHERTTACMARFSETAQTTGRKLPVIVFLHGCSGPRNDQAIWLARLGYVVVSPDSFAREGRVARCALHERTPDINDMRIAELAYARERLRHLDWVDQNRVFAAGVSEGGRGVADHSGAGFRAKIVMSYGCAAGGPNGLIPVLNLVGALDTDNPRTGNRLCPVTGDSRAVHVPDVGHLFVDDNFATEEIRKFLARFQ